MLVPPIWSYYLPARSVALNVKELISRLHGVIAGTWNIRWRVEQPVFQCAGLVYASDMNEVVGAASLEGLTIHINGEFAARQMALAVAAMLLTS